MKSVCPCVLMTASIHMLFKPEHVQRAVELLRSGVEMIGAKTGCRACTLSRDAVEEGRVHYTEEWESEQPFQRHLRSDEFQRVLLAMDMSAEEPEVTVGNLTGYHGIAHLRNLRNRPHPDHEDQPPRATPKPAH